MGNDASEVRSAFREELWELRDTVVRMGSFVQGMLSRAMQALVNQDFELAAEVRRSDDVCDGLNLDIEQVALRLLALQQPLARDLRAITAALRMGADLERIGDYAKDIAKVAQRLAGTPYFWPLEDIPLMARHAGEMVHLAMRSFVDGDLELARRVAAMDDRLDDLWETLRAQLLDHMRQDPNYIDQAVHLLLVARYLERVGDHTVNLVERVNYLETGVLENLA